MTSEELAAAFEQHNDEFLKFDSIPEDQRRHVRPDLCAFIYLHEKLGGEHDVVGGAEHDEIILSFDGLDRLSVEDVIYISRCGVRYSEEYESLCMFV